jgi:iron uptake system component EfeO
MNVRLALFGASTVALMIVAGAGVYWLARHPSQPPAGAQESAAAGQDQNANIAVNVTAAQCDPSELTVPAGRVTFAIHNSGERALEWEILQGVMVVEERENIAPGFTQKLTTRLQPGDYDITCGLTSNPKGKLHVIAAAGASVKPTEVDLIGPLAEYRVYASNEIDALADDAKLFAEAAKSGDLASARKLFARAHAHYARLAPIVGLFPDLDAAIDAAAIDPGKQQADPAFAGFHRLEWALFANPQPGDLAPTADKLVADIAVLQRRFETLAMSPEPTIAGAVDTLAKTAPARVRGEVDRASGADLSDLSANVEGVRKIVDLFEPLIQRADAGLSHALIEDFAALEATLAKYKNADGVFASSSSVRADDRTSLQRAAKNLADELARVRGALGLS